MTRTAAEIGAGLAPARLARRIVPGERIHVVGIAGAGASGAALLARRAGAIVSGCDAGGPSPYAEAVAAAGIPVAWQHDPAHVTGQPRPTRLAVTKALTAIAPDHPELASARAAGIPVEPWQQLVADAAAGSTLVAVSGTHGKSTTAGWLVHVLVAAGRDPSAFVGALLPSALGGGIAATARLGGGDIVVVEADEYAGNFDPYAPAHTIVTNVDWDHPDVFADRAAVVAAFAAWFRAAPRHSPAATAYVNVGDAGGLELARRLSTEQPMGLVVTRLVVDGEPIRAEMIQDVAVEFGRSGQPAGVLLGRVVASDATGLLIQVRGSLVPGADVSVRVALPGRHNAANALGVIAASLGIGVPLADVLAGVASFGGVGRRLERKGEAAGVLVYDDYGHHPTAIRATMAALREAEPGRRLWAVYEPLTYHRTAAMLDDFAAALATADAVAIADIWAGRDGDTSVTDSATLAAAISHLRPGIPCGAPGPVEATADWLAARVRPGDLVLVMGGGRSYRIAERLLGDLRGTVG